MIEFFDDSEYAWVDGKYSGQIKYTYTSTVHKSKVCEITVWYNPRPNILFKQYSPKTKSRVSLIQVADELSKIFAVASIRMKKIQDIYRHQPIGKGFK
jgi:hypothetical protein